MESGPTTAIGDVATTSCERCRRRKIKCDRQCPCASCKKAGTQCVVSGSGEKQRPVPKSYVQALERRVASLELFIQQLAAADKSRRDELLASYIPEPGKTGDFGIIPSRKTESSPEAATEHELVLARARTGQLRKHKAGKSSQFFGGTSLFQIHHTSDCTPSTTSLVTDDETHDGALGADEDGSPPLFPDPAAIAAGHFPYSPHDETSQKTMTSFFRDQYPYHMCVYREFFLRDYDIAIGPYYSEVLLYSICAMGALSLSSPNMLAISSTFALHAETLVYASLDKPDLTILQALMLLGYHAIGHGKASKGWLFCGMAFRLAHEMGLHLDPSNWNNSSAASSEPQIDREILRRVYWAAFNADKQLSLYFGRPPALYPHESDVRNTIRIPYPADWQGLLETYMASKGISATAYEDGISLAGSFIYRVELYKIVHTMITDLFENRRHHADSGVLAATAQRIHVSLNKWLATLPGKLYWNQWSNGRVQPFVLHLHMLFHTTMIILHRPPRHLFLKPGISTSDDVEICFESLQALLRLLRTYSKLSYPFSALPIDVVHTLSVAAGTIVMKRIMEMGDDDVGTRKSMEVVLNAMDEIQYTWPCIVEIRESVVRALEGTTTAATRDASGTASGAGTTTNAGAIDTTMSGQHNPPGPDPILDFGFLADFSASSSGGGGGDTGVPPASGTVVAGDANFSISEADLGLLLTDDFLMGQFSWDDPSPDDPTFRFGETF
ncbi:fungal-specific transcription factor domain-containing protein [Pseudomassariella vexata]|uniref:Fungal-specific transcription factor domain-domain-containing protein n=1 Tax=Pseudomassariella vexata TaxID=1141098 RepID=A0A1Y2DY40_9PEZI|nr:fungal-specific transcription factor domain-containing protein [Pseudomassariella vexata]ORY64026.1 fungal-specific transcription factor domain-domain-containing protein [Pseudomassariella vexata]